MKKTHRIILTAVISAVFVTLVTTEFSFPPCEKGFASIVLQKSTTVTLKMAMGKRILNERLVAWRSGIAIVFKLREQSLDRERQNDHFGCGLHHGDPIAILFEAQ